MVRKLKEKRITNKEVNKSIRKAFKGVKEVMDNSVINMTRERRENYLKIKNNHIEALKVLKASEQNPNTILTIGEYERGLDMINQTMLGDTIILDIFDNPSFVENISFDEIKAIEIKEGSNIDMLLNDIGMYQYTKLKHDGFEKVKGQDVTPEVIVDNISKFTNECVKTRTVHRTLSKIVEAINKDREKKLDDATVWAMIKNTDGLPRVFIPFIKLSYSLFEYLAMVAYEKINMTYGDTFDLTKIIFGDINAKLDLVKDISKALERGEDITELTLKKEEMYKEVIADTKERMKLNVLNCVAKFCDDALATYSDTLIDKLIAYEADALNQAIEAIGAVINKDAVIDVKEETEEKEEVYLTPEEIDYPETCDCDGECVECTCKQEYLHDPEDTDVVED